MNRFPVVPGDGAVAKYGMEPLLHGVRCPFSTPPRMMCVTTVSLSFEPISSRAGAGPQFATRYSVLFVGVAAIEANYNGYRTTTVIRVHTHIHKHTQTHIYSHPTDLVPPSPSYQ